MDGIYNFKVFLMLSDDSHLFGHSLMQNVFFIFFSFGLNFFFINKLQFIS